MRRLTLAACLLSVAGAAIAATTGGFLSIPELTRRADVVVIGTVVGSRSHWDRTRSVIVTDVTVRPTEALKGSVAPPPVTFQHPGGRVGDLVAAVEGVPAFTPGEQVLLFLVRGPDRDLRLLSLFQGKFSLEHDPASGARVAVRRIPDSNQVVDRMPLERARSEIRTALPDR